MVAARLQFRFIAAIATHTAGAAVPMALDEAPWMEWLTDPVAEACGLSLGKQQRCSAASIPRTHCNDSHLGLRLVNKQPSQYTSLPLQHEYHTNRTR